MITDEGLTTTQTLLLMGSGLALAVVVAWTLFQKVGQRVEFAIETVTERMEQFHREREDAFERFVTTQATAALNATTGDNKQLIINVRPEELDVNAGFRFVGLTLTNSGGTVASLFSAAIIGVNPRTGSAAQAASVAQAVP